MAQAVRRPSSEGRRSAGRLHSMEMAQVEELRRRIESLENHHSGIGSEVAVVKAEVGTMQRDINFLRTSVDNVGTKIDHLLNNMTTMQATQRVARPPRDPLDVMKNLGSFVVSIGAVIAMIVGGVKFISSTSAPDDDVRRALHNIESHLEQAAPKQRQR